MNAQCRPTYHSYVPRGMYEKIKLPHSRFWPTCACDMLRYFNTYVRHVMDTVRHFMLRAQSIDVTTKVTSYAGSTYLRSSACSHRTMQAAFYQAHPRCLPDDASALHRKTQFWRREGTAISISIDCVVVRSRCAWHHARTLGTIHSRSHACLRYVRIPAA